MLFGWMKSLIIYLILAGLAVNLSPGKNYKRYIGFFNGLIVIIILGKPISYILGISGGDIDAITEGIDYYLSTNNNLDVADNMYDYYDMSMDTAIENTLLQEGIDVDRVIALSDDEGNVLSVNVYVSETFNESDTNRLKICISDVYNVNEDSINVLRR